MTDHGVSSASSPAPAAPAAAGGRRARGGSESRRAARRGGGREQLGQILRKIPCFEVMNQEALEIIEANADTVLEEVGLEFRGDPAALSRKTGAASRAVSAGR